MARATELLGEEGPPTSEGFYAESRKYMTLAHLRELRDETERLLSLGEGAVAYDHLFKTPEPESDLFKTSGLFADASLALDPMNGGAAFNAGVAAWKLGRIDEAADQLYFASFFSGVASHALWYLGDLLNEQEKVDEAVYAYQKAIRYSNYHQGIYRSKLGDLYRRTGRIEQSLEHYHRALEFEHLHIPEMIELEAPLQASTNMAIQLTTTLIEDCSVEATKLIGQPASIYSWESRFYAVPKSLGRISAIELTTEGMVRPGLPRILDGMFSSTPIFNRMGREIVRKVLPGVVYRYERRLIRSADNFDDLLAGRFLAGLAETWVTAISAPDGEAYNVVYWAEYYFAIPPTLLPIPFSDLLEFFNGDSKKPIGLPFFLLRHLWVYRVLGGALRKLAPKTMHRFDMLRIRRSDTVEGLFDDLSKSKTDLTGCA